MKVTIRPWRPEDSAALTFIANNRNLWNMLRDRLPSPYLEEDAKNFIHSTTSRQPAEHMCIEADGNVTGSIGLTVFDDIYRGNVEIGYYISEALWGKGLATEAVRQLVNYILQNFNPVRIIAKTIAHNTASMRVLEKNGFHLEAIHRKGIIKNNTILDEYVWVIFNASNQ